MKAPRLKVYCAMADLLTLISSHLPKPTTPHVSPDRLPAPRPQ